MASPISCGFCARGPQRVVVLVGERDARDLAQEGGDARDAPRASTWRATRARQLVALLLERLAVVDAAARRMARPSMPNGEPAPSESPAPNSTSARCSLALHPLDELLPQARLADARRRR